MDYKFDDLCLMFPQADESTLEEMAKDIKEHGLADPIITYKGKILDGRNRLLACQKAGVKPTFTEYIGDDPFHFVVSKNLHRRHLSDGQKAFMVLRVIKASENKGRPVTIKEACEGLQVSQNAVTQARRIDRLAIPDIRDAVEEGTVPLSSASSLVKEALDELGIYRGDEVPESSMGRFKKAQEDILRRNLMAKLKAKEDEEYSDKILSGVFDSTQYRRNITELQTIIAKLETIPSIFSETVDLVGTLEQEKMLLATIEMLASSARRVLKNMPINPSSFDDILKLMSELINNRFKLPQVPKTPEKTLLIDLRAQITSNCNAFLSDLSKMRDRVRNGGHFDD